MKRSLEGCHALHRTMLAGSQARRARTQPPSAPPVGRRCRSPPARPRDASGRTKIDASPACPLPHRGSEPRAGSPASQSAAPRSAACPPSGSGRRSGARAPASLLPLGSQLDHAAASGGVGPACENDERPDAGTDDRGKSDIEDPEAEPVRASDARGRGAVVRSSPVAPAEAVGGRFRGHIFGHVSSFPRSISGFVSPTPSRSLRPVVAEDLAMPPRASSAIFSTATLLVSGPGCRPRRTPGRESALRAVYSCRGRQGRRRLGSRRTAHRRSYGS